jgi:hypothetical protein
VRYILVKFPIVVSVTIVFVAHLFIFIFDLGGIILDGRVSERE